MISVTLNRPDFEYDIHSLIKAFYPKEYVRVSQGEKCCGTKDDVLWLRIFVEYPTEQTKDFLRITGQCIDRDSGEPKILPKRDIPISGMDRTETKNKLKQGLYEMLSSYTGKTLPWGTLTGIRPTKIPMKLLEEGKEREEIKRYMQETYFTSADKAALAIDIAERELALLSKLDYEKGYSLYIGIPFCPTTCLYCSFPSYPVAAWAKRIDAYLDALEKEMAFVAESCAGRALNTIYIGGGTPTTLEPYQLDRLIQNIKCRFDLSACLEFTVEAGRPDSITEEKLAVLREHAISRISINPQTMKQETLRLIGRHHTVEETTECFLLARRLGFDNINMDLILGLPEETISDVRHTMERLRELAPDNLTVHSLALKRAARLNICREEYKDYQMINTQEHMDIVAAYAREMGLFPYYLYRQKGMAGNLENVGYARPGKAGIYNILIMEEKQTILGLGAGSTTKFVLPNHGNTQIIRVENVKDVEHYLTRTEEMIERKRKKMEEIGWH